MRSHFPSFVFFLSSTMNTLLYNSWSFSRTTFFAVYTSLLSLPPFSLTHTQARMRAPTRAHTCTHTELGNNEVSGKLLLSPQLLYVCGAPPFPTMWNVSFLKKRLKSELLF